MDRYPFTLKQAFIADYRAGKTASQHLGSKHLLNAGSKQGRVLEVVTGAEDINDYGAYVENYGITLYEYRKDPRAIMNGGYLHFNWGKETTTHLAKPGTKKLMVAQILVRSSNPIHPVFTLAMHVLLIQP